MQILFINQYYLKGVTQIDSSSFVDFNINNSLIELVNIDVIQFNNITVRNILVNNNQLSSPILLDQSNQFIISNSNFENCTNSYGYGGSMYIIDSHIIQINNSTFSLNKCLMQNGGAISVINSNQVSNMSISNSYFVKNYAQLSTGGAINIINANLILNNCTIQLNQALIGGGVFYSKIVPDFILDTQSGQLNKNNISLNSAKFYGQNYGSTLRSIKINLNDIMVSVQNTSLIEENDLIYVKKFQSGGLIEFSKIQLLDEEKNPLQMSNIELNINTFSQDVQTIIQSLGVYLQWDQQNTQIQCTGELSSKQFTGNGMKLNAQIMYKPESEITISVVSNNFPKLVDSKGNIFQKQGPFYKDITFQIESCFLGQITKQQSGSIICEDCPEGKYSLNIKDNACQQCPESASNCYKSTIILKNGYWRENELTDQIISCRYNPLFCQAESTETKDYCIIGHYGPLCFSCDSYGKLWGKRYQQIFHSGTCYECEENSNFIIVENIISIILIFLYIFALLKNIIKKCQAKLAGYYINKANILFLGSTLSLSDKAQIASKILTDHLQILSLYTTFSISIPSYFKIPTQLSGDTLSFTSKSIDCLISKYPSLQPLWFYQSLWSLFSPFSLIIFYILSGILAKVLYKNKTILKYFKTACIFIYLQFFPMVIILLSRSLNCVSIGDKSYLDLDFNIRCFDDQYHQPFIFYFSLPFLVIWVFIIPLILFIKIRNGKKYKWSILTEIKYSFVFAGYKQKFYYWEFGKLVYKSLIILISILLQQNDIYKVIFFKLNNVVSLKLSLISQFQRNCILRNQIHINFLVFKKINYSLYRNHSRFKNIFKIIYSFQFLNKKVCLMNIAILFQLFMIFKFKPYIMYNSNYLLQKSALICALSLNLTTVIAKTTNYILQLFFLLLLLFTNLQIIIQLIIEICSITITSNAQNRSFLEKCLFCLKQKFPSLFENIKIQSKDKIKYLMKIKIVKKKIKELIQYFRNNSFYDQKSVQLHFNLQSTKLHSPKSTPNRQTQSKFILQNLKTSISKSNKVDSFKNMRDKWQYYTRQTKDSPLMDKTSDNVKETTIFELTTQYGHLNNESEKDYLTEMSSNKNFKQMFNQD